MQSNLGTTYLLSDLTSQISNINVDKDMEPPRTVAEVLARRKRS